jgi:hypothetical protein
LHCEWIEHQLYFYVYKIFVSKVWGMVAMFSSGRRRNGGKIIDRGHLPARRFLVHNRVETPAATTLDSPAVTHDPAN